MTRFIDLSLPLENFSMDRDSPHIFYWDHHEGGRRTAKAQGFDPDQIPDGSKASYEEMVAGQKQVQQFNNDINAYNACLDLELESLEKSGQYDENRLAELRAMQAKKNNAAVDEVQAVADRFNEQLRIFKARDKQD